MSSSKQQQSLETIPEHSTNGIQTSRTNTSMSQSEDLLSALLSASDTDTSKSTFNTNTSTTSTKADGFVFDEERNVPNASIHNNDTQEVRSILVTGDEGVNVLLIRKLLVEHNCHVFMGTTNVDRGFASLKQIIFDYPEKANKIEMILLDVTNEQSVKAAANAMQSRGTSLYAVVNNASVDINKNDPIEKVRARIVSCNLYGPKRVANCFNDDCKIVTDRIVNVSSDSALVWLHDQKKDIQQVFQGQGQGKNKTMLFEHVEKIITTKIKNTKDVHGLSKAGEYLSEGAAREWSTVDDISIPLPSFKPVSLSLSRSSRSKTPKQVFFNPINIFDSFTFVQLYY